MTGVLHTVLEMIEKGATHLGVATDHVIESFRNRLWPGYKTAQGVERALLAQFHPLEEALAAMGVAVWPMVELEADDALASAARIAAADESVQKVCIWTPDKDLAQCVREDRVVQVDRRGNKILTAEGVREKFGVDPVLIPDFLALVGDAADGYPGIPGIGPKTAARLLNRYGSHRELPSRRLAGPRSGAAVQGPGDAPDRRAPLPRCRRAPLARPHPRLRRVRGAARRRSPAAALPRRPGRLEIFPWFMAQRCQRSAYLSSLRVRRGQPRGAPGEGRRFLLGGALVGEELADLGLGELDHRHD